MFTLNIKIMILNYNQAPKTPQEFLFNINQENMQARCFRCLTARFWESETCSKGQALNKPDKHWSADSHAFFKNQRVNPWHAHGCSHLFGNCAWRKVRDRHSLRNWVNVGYIFGASADLCRQESETLALINLQEFWWPSFSVQQLDKNHYQPEQQQRESQNDFSLKLSVFEEINGKDRAIL